MKQIERHGLRQSQLYKVWAGIKDRTTRGNHQNKNNYSRLNIKMCEEWQNSFQAFYDWAIKNGYKYEKLANGKNKYSIDRIDTYGDYCPENCRWATIDEQQNNTTRNRIIEYNGEKHTLSQWCKKLNIDYCVVNQRLHYGWEVKRAFEESNDRKSYFVYNGRVLSKKDIAKETGLSISNIENRIHRGWDIERIMTQPARKFKEK